MTPKQRVLTAIATASLTGADDEGYGGEKRLWNHEDRSGQLLLPQLTDSAP
jgi:hypothetical protein